MTATSVQKGVETSRAGIGSPSEQGAAVLAGYRRQIRRRVALLVLLTLAIVVALVADVLTGPSDLGISEVLGNLLGDGPMDETTLMIIREVRLPGAVMALLVGMGLSLAGAELQTTLRNPLASPFTLGLSSAAILGAALAIVLGVRIPGVPDHWVISTNAFVFAFGSVLLLQAAVRRRGSSTELLVLLGTALFFTFNALVAILQFIAGEQALQQLVFWTMGSLGRASWPRVQLVAIVVACVVPFTFRASWQLNALRLGEERAHSFGVNVAQLRRASLLRISLLTATAVAFVGTIPFVGLAGPHIARMLVSEDHRFFLPASALSGALVVSLASVVSKLIVPGAILPIGLVTALIGVPFYVVLIFGTRGGARS
ncbi:MAG TPA: iron ABC transporter permease [Gemmatimonas sp.]